MRGGIRPSYESAIQFPAFVEHTSGNLAGSRNSPANMQHQTNGTGATGANNVNMLSGLPQAGQQMDINILYNLVLQLSEELAQNRQYVSSLVTSVQRLETRASEEGVSPTLANASVELHNSNSSNNAASRHLSEVTRLQNELAAANRTIASLTESNTAYSNLVIEHDNNLTNIIERIRPYAHSHTDHVLALHRHYNNIISQERQEKMEIRLEQQRWQNGLGRVVEYARLALREESEGSSKWVNKVARLKQENRILRKIANVEEGWESSEDDEEEVVNSKFEIPDDR